MKRSRLAWIAAISFVLWGLLNVGVFLPVSFVGMRRGSLELVKMGQMAKAGAAFPHKAKRSLWPEGVRARNASRSVFAQTGARRGPVPVEANFLAATWEQGSPYLGW